MEARIPFPYLAVTDTVQLLPDLVACFARCSTAPQLPTAPAPCADDSVPLEARPRFLWLYNALKLRKEQSHHAAELKAKREPAASDAAQVRSAILKVLSIFPFNLVNIGDPRSVEVLDSLVSSLRDELLDSTDKQEREILKKTLRDLWSALRGGDRKNKSAAAAIDRAFESAQHLPSMVSRALVCQALGLPVALASAKADRAAILKPLGLDTTLLRAVDELICASLQARGIRWLARVLVWICGLASWSERPGALLPLLPLPALLPFASVIRALQASQRYEPLAEVLVEAIESCFPLPSQCRSATLRDHQMNTASTVKELRAGSPEETVANYVLRFPENRRLLPIWLPSFADAVETITLQLNDPDEHHSGGADPITADQTSATADRLLRQTVDTACGLPDAMSYTDQEYQSFLLLARALWKQCVTHCLRYSEETCVREVWDALTVEATVLGRTVNVEPRLSSAFFTPSSPSATTARIALHPSAAVVRNSAAQSAAIITLSILASGTTADLRAEQHLPLSRLVFRSLGLPACLRADSWRPPRRDSGTLQRWCCVDLSALDRCRSRSRFNEWSAIATLSRRARHA